MEMLGGNPRWNDMFDRFVDPLQRPPNATPLDQALQPPTYSDRAEDEALASEIDDIIQNPGQGYMPLVQGMGDDTSGLEQMLSQETESPRMEQYAKHLESMPQRPASPAKNNFHRLMLALDAAVSGPAEAEYFANAPYKRQLEDWDIQTRPLAGLAELEGRRESSRLGKATMLAGIKERRRATAVNAGARAEANRVRAWEATSKATADRDKEKRLTKEGEAREKHYGAQAKRWREQSETDRKKAETWERFATVREKLVDAQNNPKVGAERARAAGQFLYNEWMRTELPKEMLAQDNRGNWTINPAKFDDLDDMQKKQAIQIIEGAQRKAFSVNVNPNALGVPKFLAAPTEEPTDDIWEPVE